MLAEPTSNTVCQTDAAEKSMNDSEFAETFARIENHYFINKGFFPSDSFLIDNVTRIRHIPTIIVQGRYTTLENTQFYAHLSTTKI